MCELGRAPSHAARGSRTDPGPAQAPLARRDLKQRSVIGAVLSQNTNLRAMKAAGKKLNTVLTTNPELRPIKAAGKKLNVVLIRNPKLRPMKAAGEKLNSNLVVLRSQLLSLLPLPCLFLPLPSTT